MRRPELVLRQTSAVFEHNKDEINQMCVSPEDNFLASCDDTGSIKVIDVEKGKLTTVLSKHSNICSSVKFRPTKPNQLLSGGLDCTIRQWNWKQGTLMRTYNIFRNVNSMQIVNPPHVHSIDISPDGDCVVAGVGDGSLSIIDVLRDVDLELPEAHLACVSQVRFPLFAPGHIVSGSNDERLKLWKLNTKKFNKHGEIIDDITLALTIDQKSKINWLATTPNSSCGNLFVADITEEVSSYLVH